MNASYAFRSHLMQQFAAQARTQSRPPLALIGLLNEDNHGSVLPEVDNYQQVDSSQRFRHLSSIEDSASSNVNLRRRHTDSDIFSSTRNHPSIGPIHFKEFSSSASPQDVHEDGTEDESKTKFLEGNFNLPLAFQNLLQTRRSTSRFKPLTAPEPIYEEQDYWGQALERAVLCGYQAPNHKRTEPFTFKRMIAPSERTERLAEIAYQVSLRESTKDLPLLPEKIQAAERKREKWSKIPAFLVATVEEESSILENDLESLDEYDFLPYVPPQSERALEDYASACAAVQNVLLSLHSEQIATKWVTGSVVKTPAFRDLIQAKDNDRIVALIMVGQSGTSVPKRPRRNRRPLRSGQSNDVLVDL